MPEALNMEMTAVSDQPQWKEEGGGRRGGAGRGGADRTDGQSQDRVGSLRDGGKVAEFEGSQPQRIELGS